MGQASTGGFFPPLSEFKPLHSLSTGKLDGVSIVQSLILMIYRWTCVIIELNGWLEHPEANLQETGKDQKNLPLRDCKASGNISGALH